MTQRYRKTRIASWLLALLVLSVLTLPESPFSSSYAAMATSAAKREHVSVSVPPIATSNSTISGSIEGDPPVVVGADPTFKIFIELNGWQKKTGTATFNQETGKWDFDIVVPPGASGSTMRIVVVPFTGNPASSTIKIQ